MKKLKKPAKFHFEQVSVRVAQEVAKVEARKQPANGKGLNGRTAKTN